MARALQLGCRPGHFGTTALTAKRSARLAACAAHVASCMHAAHVAGPRGSRRARKGRISTACHCARGCAAQALVTGTATSGILVSLLRVVTKAAYNDSHEARAHGSVALGP